MNNARPDVRQWTLNNDLVVYECSQEAVYHTDILMWEITAIIWGANTLLLGFIVEAIDQRRALPLIILLSIVGMILTGFVARVCCVAGVVKTIGYGICRQTEDLREFPTDRRLHTKIDDRYPSGMARRWVYGVSIVFSVVWIFVFSYALFLLLCRAGVS